MPMQPSPIAETVKPCLPSRRGSMCFVFVKGARTRGSEKAERNYLSEIQKYWLRMLINQEAPGRRPLSRLKVFPGEPRSRALLACRAVT